MADKPVAEVVDVDAVIDALSPSPTSSDVYEATLPFNPHAVAASAVRRAGEGGGGDPFNGGDITEAMSITPTVAETDPALVVDTLNSGNTVALVTYGATTLFDDSEPLTVHRAEAEFPNPVLTVTTDGKLSLTPDINTQSASQPALAVDAAAAITKLFRLRTGANDVCTVDKLGTVTFFKPGGTNFANFSPDFIQLHALNAGADIELCQSDGTMVIQTTDDGKIGFYNHAAVAQQTGVAVTAAGIHAALVALGLITA